mgnify:CR=1 FL=1
MNPSVTEKKSTLTTLIVFLLVLGFASALAHFALVYLVPTSLYVGALMMTPTLAAFVTLKLRGRSISSLPWSWGGFRAELGRISDPGCLHFGFLRSGVVLRLWRGRRSRNPGGMARCAGAV